MSKRKKRAKKGASTKPTQATTQTPTGAQPAQSAQAASAQSQPAASKRQVRREQQMRSKRNRNIGMAVVAVILVAAVAGVFVIQSRGDSSALANGPALELSDPVLGTESAPVTIVEYGDFGCPSCRAWHNAGIQQAIMDRYGEQVQFVWKDFPVITAQSPKAAEAGQCAGAQGKFWEYHDYLYESAPGIRVNDLKDAASVVGLDQDAFDACLDGGQATAKVRDNLQEARGLRLRGTPSFTVNGEVLPGPPSFTQLEQMILAAL